MKKISFLSLCLVLLNGAVAQWATQNSGTSGILYAICATDAVTAYAAGQGGTLLKTTDGGATWVALSPGITSDIYGLSFPDANTGYACGDGGLLLKTTDAGSTWTQLNTNTTGSLVAVCFPDAGNGYMVGSDESGYLMMRTANGGAGWTIKYGTDPSALWAVHSTTANISIAYAVGFDFMNQKSVVMKTSNGGSTWAKLTCNATVWLQGVYFINASVGFAVGDYGTILKTTNGGSWLPKVSGTVQSLNSVCFTDANTGYACGSSGTILKTSDGGNTWFRQTTNSDRWFLSISFANASNGVSAGYWGQISGTTNGGGPAVGMEDHALAGSQLKISPNPATDRITVSTPENGRISILDLKGRELLNIPVTGISSTINIGSMPAGIYFIRLTTDTGILVNKIVKH